MHGKMTHTVEHRRLPINAMMASKAGKMIAVITKTIIMTIRITILSMPRDQADSPTRSGLVDKAWTLRPEKSSTVETIGRAFRGSLVRGMIAMDIDMRTVNA